ncbi:MAG: hypothetical protein ACJ8J0_10695, partial [Longimicrobiaceae bacterium]
MAVFRRCFALAAPALLLSACTDDTPTPLGADASGRRSEAVEPATSGRHSDIEFRDRFDIALDVHGSLKPGHPIQLTVTGRANYATDDAEIRLTLPEHAAAKRSGWEVVELPLNQQPTSEFLLRQGFSAGETFRGQTSVVFPEPGYYYVVATAQQLSDDHDFDGDVVVGTGAARGFWL